MRGTPSTSHGSCVRRQFTREFGNTSSTCEGRWNCRSSGSSLNVVTVNRVGSAAALAPSAHCWSKRPVAKGRLGFGQRFEVKVTPHARHNTLVNRTCCGSADRAVISLFARPALPQRAGYRQRYPS